MQRPEYPGLNQKVKKAINSAKKLPNGIAITFEGQGSDWKIYFEKITRGLCFFHTNKMCRSKKFLFEINLDLNSIDIYSEFFKNLNLVPEIDQLWNDGRISDNEIFSYKYIVTDNNFILRMEFYKHLVVHTGIKIFLS